MNTDRTCNLASNRVSAASRSRRRILAAVEALEVRLVLSTIVVNTVLDQVDSPASSTISLRDAVTRADQSTSPTTISFDPKVFATAQTITLGKGALELSNTNASVSIVGPAAGVTIAGAGLTVDAGVTASLSGSTVSGAGINNSGNLTASNCTITDDPHSGIDNSGTLVLQDSTISGNNLDGGIYGPGGGLLNGGVATVTGCDFSGNVATAYSEAFPPGADNTIRPDLGSDTSVGGAILNGSGGTLTLTNSTLSGNDADLGAAIYNSGTASVSDCTISGSYQNIYNQSGTLTLANSIVTGDTSNSYNIDVIGTVKSLGHNLIEAVDSRSSGFVSTDLTGTSASPLNPDLAPLGNYGGATQAQPPLAGSPAIGAGSVALIPAGVTTDQRGFARVVAGKVDIGAVELQNASAVPVTPPAAQTVAAGKSASIKLGSFTDPAGKGPFTVNVVWGDGSPDSSFTVSAVGSLGSLTHTFAGAPTFTVTVIVSDASGDVSPPASFPVSPSGAVISGTVFNDANGDGSQDNGEAGLGDVQVYADLGNVGYFVAGDPTTTTNAAGGYSLGGLATGNYIVRQVAPSGFNQTAPANGFGHHVSVFLGQDLSGQNFGDQSTTPQPAAITGTVFNDANGDGAQDNGETGLAGVQVYADLDNFGYFVTGDPITVTNATGRYTLPGLAAGAYIIRQIAPAGFAQTFPSGGLGHHVTVSAGQTLSGENFGDKSTAAPPATISGTVFNDANGDGIQDNGETGLAGVQVYLDLGNVGYFVTGDPTTTTDDSGGYMLSGLAAGDYIVRQALPLGYVQTTPANGFGHHLIVSAGKTLSGENFGDKA